MAPRNVPLAYRNLLADPRRLVQASVGVGAALALVLILQGLWGGVLKQTSAYIDHSQAELFVGERGTQTLSGESSVLPLGALDAIRDVPGVQTADPVTLRYTILTLHGRKEVASLVGYEPSGPGGPWRLGAGRAVRSDGEIVVDRLLASEHRIELGQALEVMGTPFRVVGLSEGTRSWMTGYLFTSHGDAERLFGAPGTTSFVMVRTADPVPTAAAIESATDLTALTAGGIADGERALYADIMQGPLRLMIGIAFAAGTLVIALTVYSAVVERIREYGIVKAMGATSARVFRIVLGQTVMLSVAGSIMGGLLFVASSKLLTGLRPQFWIRLEASDVVWLLAAAGLMALVAAVAPTRRVARLDPASVYRG